MVYRKALIELLKVKSYTVRELSQLYGVEMDEIAEDLKHVKKSVLPLNKLVIDYSFCRDCGFTFKDREKYKTPTKCPRCKHESITEMKFRVE
jgi:predicted Zn-ribbon and HTH transcriptional regulator